MLQRFQVNNLVWIKDIFQFNKDFLRNYIAESDERSYFLEINVHYLEKLHNLHNNLPFLPETMAIENFENLIENHAANLHDKNEYVIHIRNFKRGIKS